MREPIRMGVIVPSTNIVVESDYNQIAPPGVSFHTGRAYIKEEPIDGDEAFQKLLDDIDRGIETGIRDVLTSQPHYMIMGMSGETFMGGKEGNAAFEKKTSGLAGGPISTGATAVRKGLEAVGAKNISVVTPYQPIGNVQVQAFFSDYGFSVKKLT